jgi:5-dehydro-2-deoxygluconokinase
VPVVLDIDFRPDQWHDPRAFGITLRSALKLIDVVLGTEDEINAAMLTDASQINLTHSQVSDTRVSGDISSAIKALLGLGPHILAQKRGAAGSTIHLVSPEGQIKKVEAGGFPVEVRNILGAGDAYAAGILYGMVSGWDWYKTARLANACGAILVTKHGCANFTPTHDEVMAFIQEHGGF